VRDGGGRPRRRPAITALAAERAEREKFERVVSELFGTAAAIDLAAARLAFCLLG
jgi:hypothetical protein